MLENVIAFPGLGLEFTVNRVAFTIGSKDFYWYALIIVTGFLLATLFVISQCKRFDVSVDTIYDIAVGGLVCGLIGARIYYVIFDFDAYRENLIDVFKIWEGGIAIYGGIIGAALFAFIYCKQKKLDTLNVFDVCAPGLLIGQAVGRWGNFVNVEVYGRETQSLLRMSINGGEGVHPLFLYESVWCLIGLVIIVCLMRKRKFKGEIFFGYTLWYSIGRIVFESMRQKEYILFLIKPTPHFIGLGISQAVAFILIVGSTAVLVYLYRKAKREKTLK